MVLISLLLILSVLFYIHSFKKFHDLIAELSPEWINQKGSLSFLYEGMPRWGDPNLVMAVIALAFGSKWKTLDNAIVKKYAKRIQFLLPFSIVLFAILILRSAFYAN